MRENKQRAKRATNAMLGIVKRISQPLQIFGNFSAGTICGVQLILRNCGSGVGGVERNALRIL